MVCPLCGRNNPDYEAKCLFCDFEVESKFDDVLVNAQNQSRSLLDEYSEKDSIEKHAEQGGKSNNTIKHFNVESFEQTIEDDICQIEKRAKNDAIVCIISIFLLLAGIFVFYVFILNSPDGNPFNITGMGILGAIGFGATLMCLGYEGIIPGFKLVFLASSAVLIFVLEMPILLIVDAIQIFCFIGISGGRLPAILLGTIAIIFLPFWGVIILIIIELIFNSVSGRNRKSSH